MLLFFPCHANSGILYFLENSAVVPGDSGEEGEIFEGSIC